MVFQTHDLFVMCVLSIYIIHTCANLQVLSKPSRMGRCCGVFGTQETVNFYT